MITFLYTLFVNYETAQSIIYNLPCIDQTVLSLSMRRQLPLFYEKFDCPLIRAFPALIWELSVNVRINDNTGRQYKDDKSIFKILISLYIARYIKSKNTLLACSYLNCKRLWNQGKILDSLKWMNKMNTYTNGVIKS